MSILVYPTSWNISKDYNFVIVNGYNKKSDTITCTIPFRPYRIITTNHSCDAFSLYTDKIICKQGYTINSKNVFFIFAWDKTSLDELSNNISSFVDFIDIDIPMLGLFFYYNDINPAEWLMFAEISRNKFPVDNKSDFFMTAKVLKNVYNEKIIHVSEKVYKNSTNWRTPINELDNKINYIRPWYYLFIKKQDKTNITCIPADGRYINHSIIDINLELVKLLLPKQISELLYTNIII